MTEGSAVTTIEEFAAFAEENGVHTVEIAHPDMYAHLRGKRLPIDRFLTSGVKSGIGIADAIYIFDLHCDLVDNPYINMGTGFLDTILKPDISTVRLLPHRPGYAMVFSESFNEEGELHDISPRSVLASQVERCKAAGVDPLVATELEFYLFDENWQPLRSYIQYSSLTDSDDIEVMIREMREAVGGAGMELESSNAEYGPGQWEINVGPADAMRTADSTALLKSIVKQVARAHGCRASFMPKPFAAESGSGMHIHTSLNVDGANGFASCDGAPNDLMTHWVGGLLAHAKSMALIGSNTANGFKRVRPYTFAPTHIHWGLDNRTVLARCMTEKGSKANRVEMRSAGADANPYVAIAAVLAAGLDGLQRSLPIPPMAVGDMYEDPTGLVALCTTMAEGIEAFRGSPLAEALGERFSATWILNAEHELAMYVEASGGETDEVNDWERARYLEHT